MKIAITGATGLIGRCLMARLQEAGHELHVLARAPKAGLPASMRMSMWNPEKGLPPLDALREADAVIHLAGESVAQRWTAEVKRRIRSSRVEGTRRLVEALAQIEPRPSVLISASAIGYYGDRGDEVLAESSAPGTGFLPTVCVEWEDAANGAAALGMRVVTPRLGVVLAQGGGALERMLPVFKAGLGGKLGSGEQWMSWVHLEDVAGLFARCMEDTSLRGALNATSPNPLPNADFTRVLGKVLGRPAIIPVPAGAIRLLFGEMAGVVLSSQRVMPRAATAAGYEFRYPELAEALRSVTG